MLLIGAEVLVRSASRLATSFGVSRLVVGLTVVAFGTSAPELVVSVSAATAGQPGIALGNVVGSNIANILLILGLSATILPMAVTSRVIRWDVPLMLFVSFGFGGMALDSRISRIDGLVLIASITVYIWWNVREGRGKETPSPLPSHRRETGRNSVFVILGLGALWLGGRWLVEGAVDLARWWGLSELVIGLTIVAVGTSLPEAATSVVAGLRGERDIAIGNVVGSNVFNLLAVMGASALVAPEGITVAPTALRFDIPVMIAASVACLPVAFTGAVIARWEGILFLAYYVAYVGFIILNMRAPALTPYFGRMMLYFVLPLTAITLVVAVARSLRQRHSTRES